MNLLALACLALQDPEGLDFFEKKVRPVLVEHCYSCHSAEAKKLKAELHLDTREGTLKGGETGPAVVPGDLEKSLLVKAVRYTDEDLKMPPKNKLPAAVIADLEAWVKRGAPDPRRGAAKAVKAGIDLEKGRKHWAFLPLAAGKAPEVMNSAWARTPIDRFILAKLEEKGIAANPPVDRRRLIRRAALDLTGLPPAPEEVEAFVKDDAPDAWDRLLDRLLASPAHGERWARFWLDVARFAESHGFEQDYDRENAWPYRDFVIRALNDDMPYDRFVQWQVAGDELAPQDPLAWMATGFLGAGAFPTQLTEVEFEPARYDELDNMGSTVGSAVLGLSVGCARCHDHKFDPIPSKDYYRFVSAFTTAIRSHVEFDLDPEAGRKALEAWEKAGAPVREALAAVEKELPERYDRWAAKKDWVHTPVPAFALLEITAAKSAGGATFSRPGDGSILLAGANPKNEILTLTARTTLPRITGFRLEALADPSFKKGGPGRADNGNFALSHLRVTAKPLAGGEAVPVRLASAKARFEQKGFAVAGAIDDDPKTAWAVDPQFGRDAAAFFEFAEPLTGGAELTFELGFAVGERHSIGRPRISVSTGATGVEGGSQPQEAAELREELAAGRTPPRERAVSAYRWFDADWLTLSEKVRKHEAAKPRPKLTTILVTTEGMKPLKHHADDRGFPHFYKETHVLARGDVNKKQGVATPGFLQVLTRAPEDRWQAAPPPGARTPQRRAALARWLTDVEQGPGQLAARVAVNRLWLHHFGKAIVGTPNDFGLQGDAPTHPELLDWLASELIRGGWRLKPMHKLIMSSAVYLQSADADAARAKADPDNRLYGRRDVRRLEAEAIRDSLLAVSGTLDARMYGPGTLDEGMARRSVYFFQKRSKLIPMMMLFDAPEALVSIGRRPSTTIAPQALLFMNSPHVRRYADALARKVKGPDEVAAAYRTALGRAPTAAEEKAAGAFLAAQAGSYGKDGAVRALADFCQVLMSTSEFIYVE